MNRRSIRRLGLLGGLFFALALITVCEAAAGQQTPTPFTQNTDATHLNPQDPPWCHSEDDWHQRGWAGSFTGTFTATEYFCDRQVDYFDGNYWGGAGQGFILQLIVHGALDSATVSTTGSYGWQTQNLVGGTYDAPFTQPVELVSSRLVGHGGNSYVEGTYAACVFPNSPNYPPDPITHLSSELMGTWTATVTGSFDYLEMMVETENWNTAEGPYYCPADQRLP